MLKQAARRVTGWIAAVLSIYTVFVILSTWFLVPYDPALTQSQNIINKLEIIGVAFLLLAALVKLAQWAFRKRPKRDVNKSNGH